MKVLAVWALVIYMMAGVVCGNAPPPPPSSSPITEDSRVYLGTWIGLLVAVLFVALLVLFILWNGCCRIVPTRLEVKKMKEEETQLMSTFLRSHSTDPLVPHSSNINSPLHSNDTNPSAYHAGMPAKAALDTDATSTTPASRYNLGSDSYSSSGSSGSSGSSSS